MPTVTIAGLIAVTYPSAPKHRKLVIRGGGRTITLPFAPVPSSHDGYGWDWESAARDGRTALLLRGGRNTRTWSAAITLAGATLQTAVDPILIALAKLASSGAACTIAYSRVEAGRWRLISMPYEVTARTTANRPSRAVVTLTFQEVVDPPSPIGRSRSTKKHKASSKSSPKSKGKARSYVVRPGDTLSSIAVKMYHDSSRSTSIKTANHIRNPRALRVGQKLRIP